MKAVDKFEWRRGYKFFDLRDVVDSPGDHPRDCRPGAHHPHSGAMIETINKLVRTSRQLVQELGREPTSEEIAQTHGHSGVQGAQDPEDRARTHFTGDADRGRGRFAPGRLHRRQGRGFAFGRGDQPEPEGADVFVLKTLTPREEKVIKMRFGLDDGSEHTLEEVGQSFAVTRERIRQIEAKALRKLRHPSRSRKLRAFLEALRAITCRKKRTRKQTFGKKAPRICRGAFLFTEVNELFRGSG